MQYILQSGRVFFVSKYLINIVFSFSREELIGFAEPPKSLFFYFVFWEVVSFFNSFAFLFILFIFRGQEERNFFGWAVL